MRLHITNGDSAGGTLQQAFPEDSVLSWRDCLHDGPVPAGLPLDELSAVRAQFIADCGWASYEDALRDFRARDARLARFRDFEETVLWFEHDLYDQLQLIQILDWFNHSAGRPSVIQSSTYLGPMDAVQLAALFPARGPVTSEQLALASAAWEAFRSPDPRALEPFLAPHRALPFLAAALLRYCEEFPWLEDGLTRTQRTIAVLQAQGIADPRKLYSAFSRTEDPIWMGDASFYLILEGRLPKPTEWRWDATRQRFVARPA